MRLVSDLRHAVKLLRRSPGFAGVAIGTLGAGLALCVCVTAAVDAYLLRALPYPESDRLYDVRYGTPGAAWPTGLNKLDWSSLSDVVEHAISWDLDAFTLRGAPYAEAASGAWVTAGFVEGLGIRAARGRGFEAGDFKDGAPSVALISHRLWQTRYAGDPGIVGRLFEAYVNDRPNEVETFTIIGVLPEGFWHFNRFTDIMAPLRAPSFPYMMRLREAVSPTTVADRIEALVRASDATLPEGWRPEVLSTHATYVTEVRPLLVTTASATALVLLIACANVVVLLLVRTNRRQRELAIRKALGASGGQIARVLVSEALVIGASATALGLAVGDMILGTLAPAIERQLARGVPGGLDALSMGQLPLMTGLAGGLLVTVACAVVPLLTGRRTPVAMLLAAGQRGSTDGPAQARTRSALIAIEVAACLTLLVGAVLVVDSGVRMLRVDMGLDARDVMTGRFNLRQRSYPERADRLQFYEQALSRMSQLPGVRGVAFTTAWPLQQAPLVDAGRDEATAPGSTRAGFVGVTPGYFDTLGIRMRAGRSFDANDRLDTDPVAIVSDTLARRLWPDRPAVGGRLRLSLQQMGTTTPARVFFYSVVGVAGDVRHVHTDEDLADIYVPFLQQPSRSAFTYVRVAGPVAPVERDLRAALAAIDIDTPFGGIRMLEEILEEQRARPRLLASLLVVFSVLAGLLALIGLYGVIAYAVRQREREIAVRLAMGADSRAITGLFVRQGARVLVAGLGVGAFGALLLGRLLQTQLFGVRSADPLLIAATSLAFGLCGLVAVWWPARVASSMDPAGALKGD